MTTAPPPPPPAPFGPERRGGTGSGTDAVAGLARELDALRRLVEPLAGTLDRPGRVDELSRLVAQLADTVATLTTRHRTPVPSWLLLPTETTTAGQLLDELTAWLAAVYLRYPDAVDGLPECWCWHPAVVEELLWLMHAWSAAYQGPHASFALVGDWHDRQRPGVVRRIRQTAGACSFEAHIPRPGWTHHSGAAPQVPGLGHLGVIADWWGARRDQPAPEPTSARSRIGRALNGGDPRR
jgi:hypothetical protein